MITNFIARKSKSGVPHFLFKVDGLWYSACWMGRDKFYRIWEFSTKGAEMPPFGPQRKVGDIPLIEGGECDIVKFIEDRKQRPSVCTNQDGSCSEDNCRCR